MTGRATDPRVTRLHPLAVYGLAGVVISAVVNVATYFGIAPSAESPLIFVVSFAIFPLFVAFIWRMNAWQVVRPGPFGFKMRQLRWRELLPSFPWWTAAVIPLLFLYAMINFMLAFMHLPHDGLNTGTPQTTIDLYSARLMSGHWLLFYAVPTIFFVFAPRTVPPRSD